MTDERTDVQLDPRTEALQTWAAEADREARLDLLQTLYRMRREKRRPRLTQAEVAARMGISQATVSAFESRKAVPRLATLQRYARAIGVRLSVTLEQVSPEEEFAGRLAELDSRVASDAPQETGAHDNAGALVDPLNPRFSAAS